jgi:hypothetical protein
MPEITYALIKSLIVKEQPGEHNTIQLEFQMRAKKKGNRQL